MASLDDLPAELLEQIFLQQEDGEDMLSLASSSPRLRQVLAQPRVWRRLLAKSNFTKKRMNFWCTHTVNYPLIQKMTTFLKTVEDQDLLLGLLHESIVRRHPGDKLYSSVSVRLPLLPRPYRVPQSVTVLGLLLLILTRGQGQGPTILTMRVTAPGILLVTAPSLAVTLGQEEEVIRDDYDQPHVEGREPSSLIGVLAALVTLQEEPVRELEVTSTVFCRTAEGGRALAGLLQSCTSWRLGALHLNSEGCIGNKPWMGPRVGRGTWQRLARAAGKGPVLQGSLEEVKTRWIVLDDAREEDVRKVWESTRRGFIITELGRVEWERIANVFTPWYIYAMIIFLYFFVLFAFSFSLAHISMYYEDQRLVAAEQCSVRHFYNVQCKAE